VRQYTAKFTFLPFFEIKTIDSETSQIRASRWLHQLALTEVLLWRSRLDDIKTFINAIRLLESILYGFGVDLVSFPSLGRMAATTFDFETRKLVLHQGLSVQFL
jgi:hypothetical protein